MEFPDKLKLYKDKIDSSLLDLFNDEKPELLYEPMKYIVNIGGKRLRPILCEIFYRLFTKEVELIR